MIKDMIDRIMYKRYLKGKKKITFTHKPDHMADCIDIGHIRDMKF